ncbi:endonuclease domain-containing protein [Nonomuraea sp. NPDC050556]|uniref:endonuclease domain-containing protein n=1 Tax=Nonomuraea sp. NPDC050556 TaxID=3364369 RepID=UPI0037B4B550
MEPPLLTRARLYTTVAPAAVACRRTAAHVWGLSALPFSSSEDDWPVELIVPAPLEIPGCATFVEHLTPVDITHHRGVRLTTPLRTALDCARCLPKVEAVTLLDQFLRRGVELDDLAVHPFWRVREILSLTDRGAASPRESWLRVVLVDGGLPKPTTQIRVGLGGDRVAYLDLGWEPYRVAVEYDGHEHHTSSADRRRDKIRRAELRGQGWRVIPVRRDVIPARTGDLVEAVANALIERGWQPAPAQTVKILSRIRAARRRPR